MNIPASLRYTKAHLWVKMDGDTAIVGITDYAQNALGNIIYINLPGEGDSVTAGESFGDVESEKTTSEMLCPVSGTICAVNEDLMDAPDDLNYSPYRSWVIKVTDISGTDDLMDAEAYGAFCAE